MISFTALIKKFEKQGEKTGWTYIDVPAQIAQQLKPGTKQSFRVKGTLDATSIKGVALVPMGGGDFILAVNAAMRKSLRKPVGEYIKAILEVDNERLAAPPELLACLEEEPEAEAYFRSLAPSHQLYFIKWIDSAKTDGTRTGRIAHAINAFVMKLDYGQMIRRIKAEKKAFEQ